MRISIIAILCLLTAAAWAEAVEPPPAEDEEQIGISEAIKRLQEGNARFVAGQARHPHESPDWRSKLEHGQHPFAVVLGCSDSRVPPELVFDQGLGDLFVIRVAGNVVDTDATASIEYASEHLGTRLIVVMGHSQCGAVSATVDHLVNADGEPAEVISLLHQIEPAVIGISPDIPRDQQVSQAIRRNVELAVRWLSRVPSLRRGITDGRIKVLGAIYDMHTGKVELLEACNADLRRMHNASSTTSFGN